MTIENCVSFDHWLARIDDLLPTDLGSEEMAATAKVHTRCKESGNSHDIASREAKKKLYELLAAHKIPKDNKTAIERHLGTNWKIAYGNFIKDLREGCLSYDLKHECLIYGTAKSKDGLVPTPKTRRDAYDFFMACLPKRMKKSISLKEEHAKRLITDMLQKNIGLRCRKGEVIYALLEDWEGAHFSSAAPKIPVYAPPQDQTAPFATPAVAYAAKTPGHFPYQQQPLSALKGQDLEAAIEDLQMRQRILKAGSNAWETARAPGRQRQTQNLQYAKEMNTKILEQTAKLNENVKSIVAIEQSNIEADNQHATTQAEIAECAMTVQCLTEQRMKQNSVFPRTPHHQTRRQIDFDVAATDADQGATLVATAGGTTLATAGKATLVTARGTTLVDEDLSGEAIPDEAPVEEAPVCNKATDKDAALKGEKTVTFACTPSSVAGTSNQGFFTPPQQTVSESANSKGNGTNGSIGSNTDGSIGSNGTNIEGSIGSNDDSSSESHADGSIGSNGSNIDGSIGSNADVSIGNNTDGSIENPASSNGNETVDSNENKSTDSNGNGTARYLDGGVNEAPKSKESVTTPNSKSSGSLPGSIHTPAPKRPGFLRGLWQTLSASKTRQSPDVSCVSSITASSVNSSEKCTEETSLSPNRDESIDSSNHHSQDKSILAGRDMESIGETYASRSNSSSKGIAHSDKTMECSFQGGVKDLYEVQSKVACFEYGTKFSLEDEHEGGKNNSSGKNWLRMDDDLSEELSEDLSDNPEQVSVKEAPEEASVQCKSEDVFEKAVEEKLEEASAETKELYIKNKERFIQNKSEEAVKNKCKEPVVEAENKEPSLDHKSKPAPILKEEAGQAQANETAEEEAEAPAGGLTEDGNSKKKGFEIGQQVKINETGQTGKLKSATGNGYFTVLLDSGTEVKVRGKKNLSSLE